MNRGMNQEEGRRTVIRRSANHPGDAPLTQSVQKLRNSQNNHSLLPNRVLMLAGFVLPTVHVRHGVSPEVHGERLNGEEGDAEDELRVMSLIQEVVEREVLGDLVQYDEVNLIKNVA